MVRTISQRTQEEAARRKAAVERLAGELRRHALSEGGRYLLYGSAARGPLRFDSDVDLLVDFPAAAEAEAWQLAELLCAGHRLEADIRPLAWCTAAFLTAVAADAVVIG